METYRLQALRLSLGLHGAGAELSWKAQERISQQEFTLKFQEWLAARAVTSLLETEISFLESVEDALSTFQLSASAVQTQVESEFNSLLRTSPLLGYDITGNAVVRQSAVWIQRADDLFDDLDSEKRGYLVADSLLYFLAALHPTGNCREIRSAQTALFAHVSHCEGQVSRLAFKVYLLRVGRGNLQAVTTLQVRIKQMARAWTAVKALAMKCDGSLLSFCNHFAHCTVPFASIIEQSIQLALPPSYSDYSLTAEFLRMHFPGCLVGWECADCEGVVERLASGFTGTLTESGILVFCKTVTMFDLLADEVLSVLLSQDGQRPISQSNQRTAKHSPVRNDSSEKTTIRMSPGYSRQTVASSLKNVRKCTPPSSLLSSLVAANPQMTVPRVRLSIYDLHGPLRNRAKS